MNLDVRGTRLFVDIAGAAWRWEGKNLRYYPPLFLLHGGPGANHLRLKRDLGWLGKWFQLVFIDQRGCGRSDACPKKTLTLANNVADMEAVRATLGFETISMLGWSYGGMLAAEYAARYPRRLDLLFLLSTAGSGDFIRSSYAWLARHGTREQQIEGGKSIRCEKNQAVAVLNGLNQRRPTPPVPITWNEAALKIGMREDLPKWNVLKRLARVKAPTFIAVGRHDWICPVDQGEALQRVLPQAMMHVYQHSAHYPATDEPGRFRRDIVKFIQQQRQFNQLT